jgi:hypothetical protein
MFTKKSLIICMVMLFTLVGLGTVSTFAASAAPSTAKTARLYKGIAAISAVPKGVVSVQDVKAYLEQGKFVGGSTVNGNSPTIQNLKLTDISHLNKLAGIVIPLSGVVIPNVAGTRKVYYAQVSGPFALDHNLPLPALSTLFPSSTNMPVLSNMPVLKQLPMMGSLSSMTGIQNSEDLLGLSSQDSKSQPQSVAANNVLQTIYEVFDAHSGNLLAWG